MPHKTSKPKKGKQGIKELSSKHGHLLLIALQSGELRVVNTNPIKIKNNKIAVITTAKPTSNNAPTVYGQAIFAMQEATYVKIDLDNEQKTNSTGKPAPKSMAATHVKHKKSTYVKIKFNEFNNEGAVVTHVKCKKSTYIEIKSNKSNNEPGNNKSSHLPASKQQHTSRPIYNISSDSKELPQPSRKKIAPVVSTKFDQGGPTVAKKGTSTAPLSDTKKWH
ncbi:hypothetical protein C0989_004997 [Termitomyces sp. Mn162]|nr:hypothetical protein C0989_004997 [Termitomyces sp. Mn162]